MILSDTLRWNISGSLIPKEFFAQLSLEHLKPSSFFCIFFVYLIFGFLTIYSFKSDVLQFLKKKPSKVQSRGHFIIISFTPEKKIPLRLLVIYDYVFFYVWLGSPRRALPSAYRSYLSVLSHLLYIF